VKFAVIVFKWSFTMKENKDSALSQYTWKHLRKIKTADIMVGISSYNNAHTINYVIYQAAKGLETHFLKLKSAIFISDGNSTDGTLETVKAMRLPFQVSIIPATYVGTSGKGSAVKAIFEAAKFLKTKAVVLVDSDLRSITPEWIRLLISPTLTGSGLITPFYIRHKYDGTITNFLCYPVTSSLYGKEIRQPIGGDFGLSIELVKELLNSPLWQTSYVRKFGIDIFITHTALAKGFEIKQAFLGTKVHEAKDPSKHLASMFRQVVESMFTCIQRYEETWAKICDIQKVEMVGEEKSISSPETINVDLKNLIITYKSGFDTYKKIYREHLSNSLLKEVEELTKIDAKESSFPAETWAKIVYSFIASFRSGEQSKNENLIDALRILWIGKVATFVKETLGLDTLDTEERVKEEARVFVRLKPYLLDALKQ